MANLETTLRKFVWDCQKTSVFHIFHRLRANAAERNLTAAMANVFLAWAFVTISISAWVEPMKPHGKHMRLPLSSYCHAQPGNPLITFYGDNRINELWEIVDVVLEWNVNRCTSFRARGILMFTLQKVWLQTACSRSKRLFAFDNAGDINTKLIEWARSQCLEYCWIDMNCVWRLTSCLILKLWICSWNETGCFRQHSFLYTELKFSWEVVR